MSKSKEFDFSKKYAEFKKLLQWFESDELDLAAAPKKFDQAQKISEELKEYLTNAENEINKVAKDFDV